MDQDLDTLQIISDTLKEEPKASQRTLAKKANMSLGLMNAILQRFVERGWIMLTNVNGRKLIYAVSAAGIKELSERGKKFAARTFAIANEYNEVICLEIEKAKASGCKKVILYGKSYIKFLLIYACDKAQIAFSEVKISSAEEEIVLEENALCLAGELSKKDVLNKLLEAGCISLVDLVQGIERYENR